MKKIMCLMLLSGLWLNSIAQSKGGVEQYYSLRKSEAVTLMPVMYLETSENWYVECRYNYEAAQTFSMYAGKTFKKDGVISYSISPIVGVVGGRFNGYSGGFNTEIEYKKHFLVSQSQYTLSTKDKKENFAYSWTDWGYKIFPNLSAGISIQQTKINNSENIVEKGIFVQTKYGKWSVPFYFFNVFDKKVSFMLGINYEWKKNKK